MFLWSVPLQFYGSNFNYFLFTYLSVLIDLFSGKTPVRHQNEAGLPPSISFGPLLVPFWTPVWIPIYFPLPPPPPPPVLPRSRFACVVQRIYLKDEKTACTVGYASVTMISWSFQKQNILRTHLSTRILNFGESMDIADSRRSLTCYCMHWNIEPDHTDNG